MLLAEQLAQLTELFSPAATCSVVTFVMLKMLDDPVWVVRVAACQVRYRQLISVYASLLHCLRLLHSFGDACATSCALSLCHTLNRFID